MTGTSPFHARFRRVDPARRLCLVTNDMSGSNDADTLADLLEALGAGRARIVRHVSFPADSLPTPTELDRADIGQVVVFTGDGTLNAALDRLAGWGGQVLVLAGGTMNLLFHRLFGEEATNASAIAAWLEGRLQVTRPDVIGCERGNAYAGLLAGPGTAWNDVREAMRAGAVLGVAGGAMAALAETLAAPGVACREPQLGREEGYPLILLNSNDKAIEVLAFHAEAPTEYLAQGWALLKCNFREGPHDVLGHASTVTLAATGEDPLGLLLDGEPAEPIRACTFELAPCAVDLLAPGSDG